MRVNLNDNVAFVLTDSGARRYNEYLDQWKDYAWASTQRYAAGDKIEMPLHEFAFIFGELCSMGSELPAEKCALEVTNSTLRRS